MDFDKSNIASIDDEARAMTPKGTGAVARFGLNAPRSKHKLAYH
jgi:hypothetical protein